MQGLKTGVEDSFYTRSFLNHTYIVHISYYTRVSYNIKYHKRNLYNIRSYE